jgi:hypothetical protein
MTDPSQHKPKTSDVEQRYVIIDGKPFFPMEQQEPSDTEETPRPLNDAIEKLVADYVRNLNEERKDTTPIHVNDIAIAVAKFYEMIRKVVDWKDDYTLRRSAIERILKRLLFSRVAGLKNDYTDDPAVIAETITNDLIRGGHLPNDEIPQERVEYVTLSISKYLEFLKYSTTAKELPNIKDHINFTTFIIEIMACEIEDILSDPFKEKLIILTMTKLIHERLRITPKDSITQDELNAHIFISVCRTVYDLDDSYIMYHLLQFQYPDWKTLNAERIKELSSEMIKIWTQEHEVLNHAISKELYNICEKVDTIFVLLDDFLQKHRNDPEEIKQIISQKNRFTEEIREFYQKRFMSLKTRLFRLAIFSTFSVFASNWVTFFLVEIPMAKIFFEGFNAFTTFIDFLIPTIVMFLLVLIIRPPPAKNIDSVLSTLYSFVYKNEKVSLYEIRLNRRGNSVLMFFIIAFYIFLTLIGFLAVGYVFYKAGLPITSVAFDTLTIALTVFAAVNIRNKSKELIVDEKTSLTEFVMDMFSVPVAKVGSFLAKKWKEYNIVAIFFSVVIETPFNLITKIIESWSDFLKERRNELH